MSDKRIIKNFLLFEVISTSISLIMVIILLFAPWIKLLDIEDYLYKNAEMIEQIESKDENLYNKYEENYKRQQKQGNRITVLEAISEILNDIDNDDTDKDIRIGCFEFGMIIFKYTLFGGTERLILYNGFIAIGMIMLGILIFAGPITLLSDLIIKIVYFIKGSTKSDRRGTIKSIRNYSEILCFYIVALILISILRLPNVFATYPINGAFMLFFDFSPLIYVVIAIEAILLILHCIFKSKAKYTYSYDN